MLVVMRLFVITITLCLFTGCSAINTSVAKKDLQVQTKMSESIFLEPVAPAKRIVYVDIKNTSDKPNLRVESQIISAISANGFKVTDNPEEATFLLQANILQAGRKNSRAGQQDGSAGLIGGGLGSLTGDGNGRTAMAIAGALLATMVDASVEDVYYTLITDIRLSQRTADGVKSSETTRSQLTQGTSGKISVTSSESTQWKRYQTKVVSVANQVNLVYEDAEPELINGLVQNIANIF